MDPVIIGALIGLVGAATCSAVLFRSALLGGPRPVGARAARDVEQMEPDQLRYTLGVVLWSFVTGLAMLALVCLLLGLFIRPAAGGGRTLPDAALLLAGAVIALAAVAIIGTWGRFAPNVGEPAEDVTRAYRRAILAGAAWEGLGVLAVAFLLVGVY